MTVSTEQVKKFLLEVINQSSYPGHMSEFVSVVKKEVTEATIEAGDKPKVKKVI